MLLHRRGFRVNQSKLLRIFNNDGKIDQKLYDKIYFEDRAGSFLKAANHIFKQAFSNKMEKLIPTDLINTEDLNIMEIENKVKEAYKKCTDSQTNLKNISGLYRK